MHIFIPSRARSELHRTFFNLPPFWQQRTTLIVPWDEKQAYIAGGVPAERVSAVKAQGIGPVRQWIVTHTGKKVLMLDDDLDFFTRRMDNMTKLLKASPRDVAQMLNYVAGTLERYAHVGIAVREGANRNINQIIENTRMLRALAFRTDVLKRHKVKFDRTPVMEDFDVALQLLRLGYPSATVNWWTQDQPGSNTTGGCSTYRTPQVQALGAETLAKLHPDFVTVIEKPPLKSGGWSGLPRKDVRVAWKKAYDSAGGKREV